MHKEAQDQGEVNSIIVSMDVLISERRLSVLDPPYLKSLVIYYLEETGENFGKIKQDDLYILAAEIQQVDKSVSSLMTVGGYKFLNREKFVIQVYNFLRDHGISITINKNETQEKTIRDTAKGIYSQKIFETLKELFKPDGNLNEEAHRAFGELSKFIYRHAYNYFYNPGSRKDHYAAIQIDEMANIVTQKALEAIVRQDRFEKISTPAYFLAYAKITVDRECWRLKPSTKKDKNKSSSNEEPTSVKFSQE